MRKILTAFAFAASLSLTGPATAQSPPPRRTPPPRPRAAADPVAAAQPGQHPLRDLHPRQRPARHRPHRPQGAGRRGQRLVQCRLQGRARRPHRLRPSVRASDVQRLRERAGRLFRAARARSARPTSTAPPGSTAPIISRPCRAPRSSARCSSKATAWAICSARSPRRSSITSAASSRTRSARATTSRYGMVEYAQLEALFPAGHPYHHSTIGSMADLDAAIARRRCSDWFREQLRPEQRRPRPRRRHRRSPRRGRWSSAISATSRAGRSTSPPPADVPTLPRRVDRVMHDRVANTRLYRNWVVPGLTDRRSRSRSTVGATILGGLASSRLDNALVRGEQTAVSVTADVQPFHRISLFEVTVDVKPGQDADAVSRRLDAAHRRLRRAPARPPTRCAAR